MDMEYKENYFLKAWMEYYWEQIDSVFTLTTIDYHDAKRVYSDLGLDLSTAINVFLRNKKDDRYFFRRPQNTI